MPEYTRNFQYEMPLGPESMASSAGLSALNTWVDEVDSRLATVAAMGTDPTLGFGIWEQTADQSFTSTATIANVTATIANRVYIGTASQYFTVSTAGTIDFETAGFYRITIAPCLTGSNGITEGQISFGLKPSGVASYITRCATTAPMETFGGITQVSKSFIIRAASSGGDVDLTTTYYVGFQQTNSSSTSLSLRGTIIGTSWFAIEYLRPVT